MQQHVWNLNKLFFDADVYDINDYETLFHELYFV